MPSPEVMLSAIGFKRTVAGECLAGAHTVQLLCMGGRGSFKESGLYLNFLANYR